MQSRERSLFVPTRRHLGGLLAASAAVALPALPAIAAPAAVSDADRIGEAWHAQALARGALTIVSDEQDAATARMPWWARSGPMYLDHKGEHVGLSLGWPAIQDVAPPEGEGTLRRIRWSRADIEKHYAVELGFWNERERAAITQKRDIRLAELDARMAAVEVEEVRVGLPECNRRYDAAYDAWGDAEDRVSDLARASSCPAATAVLFLIELVHETTTIATMEGYHATSEMVLASIALRPLLPFLPAPLAIDVAELLDNPTRPLGDMRMSRGITGGARV